MKTESLTLTSPYDGLKLACLAAEPDDGKIRGIVQLVHGMAEMKERYLPLIRHLTDEGYACFIHDHRGHGGSVLSPDDLGFFYEGGGAALITDTLAAIEESRRRWSGRKLLLIGHSMGSFVVRCTIRQQGNAADGLIVMGTPSINGAAPLAHALASIEGKLRGRRHRSTFLNKLAFGAYQKNIPNPQSAFDWLSVNRSNVDFYLKSPLCGFIFTCDGFCGLFDLASWTYRDDGWSVTNPAMPVLFLSGSDDPCIGSAANFDKAVAHLKARGYRDVESRLFEGYRHEILNESIADEVMTVIDDWIEKKRIFS